MESKTMKELRKIKVKLSKELYGKSWEELKIWMEEKRKKREKERKQTFSKNSA